MSPAQTSGLDSYGWRLRCPFSLSAALGRRRGPLWHRRQQQNQRLSRAWRRSPLRNQPQSPPPRLPPQSLRQKPFQLFLSLPSPGSLCQPPPSPPSATSRRSSPSRSRPPPRARHQQQQQQQQQQKR